MRPSGFYPRSLFPWAAILPIQLPRIAINTNPAIFMQDEAGNGLFLILDSTVFDRWLHNHQGKKPERNESSAHSDSLPPADESFPRVGTVDNPKQRRGNKKPGLNRAGP